MNRVTDRDYIWEVYERARQMLLARRPNDSMKQINHRIYGCSFGLYQEVLQEKSGEEREEVIKLCLGIMGQIERIEGANVLESGSFILTAREEGK